MLECKKCPYYDYGLGGQYCDKVGGTKHVLRDAIKDKYGKYHDDIIYEIINN